MTKVSIIIPAFNASKTILRTLESVFAQTYKNWEAIIVDDGSTDGTANLIRETYGSYRVVRVIEHAQNSGLPRARNTGIDHASGEYVAFLDSDDVWYPEKLELQVRYHENNPHIRISHTNYEYFDERGVIKRPFWNLANLFVRKEGLLYPQILYKNPVGVLTVMAKRDLIVAHKGFDTTLRSLEDQDLWIRISEQNVAFGYLDKVLAGYYFNPDGLTFNIYKYKNAYKKIGQKHFKDSKKSKYYTFFLREYYRYFGTVYFKRKQFYLSILYFCKSVRQEVVSYRAITTWVYLVFAWFALLRKGCVFRHKISRKGRNVPYTNISTKS